MRDLANKMAELKFEAPLAQFEESDEWGPVDYQSSNANTIKAAISETLTLNLKENTDNSNNILIIDDNVVESAVVAAAAAAAAAAATITKKGGGGGVIGSPNCNTNNNMINGNNNKDTNVDNFTETFTGSLEDLVNTFDEKITKCFGNYEESVEELAPVQVRSQEEIMNECQ